MIQRCLRNIFSIDNSMCESCCCHRDRIVLCLQLPNVLSDGLLEVGLPPVSTMLSRHNARYPWYILLKWHMLCPLPVQHEHYWVFTAQINAENSPHVKWFCTLLTAKYGFCTVHCTGEHELLKFHVLQMQCCLLYPCLLWLLRAWNPQNRACALAVFRKTHGTKWERKTHDVAVMHCEHWPPFPWYPSHILLTLFHGYWPETTLTLTTVADTDCSSKMTLFAVAQIRASTSQTLVGGEWKVQLVRCCSS